jgi:uncharacterized oxidoreductase
LTDRVGSASGRAAGRVNPIDTTGPRIDDPMEERQRMAILGGEHGRHDAGEVEDLVRRILRSAGADEENAGIVASHLVQASLSGVDTHGVIQVPGYVAGIRAGEIDPTAKPSIDIDAPGGTRVRGHWGFGHVATLRGSEVGIEQALESGSAVVAVVECGHIGRVGHYAELAADAGVVALIFAGGYGVEVAASVPFGGRDRVLHTNPIAFAFPGTDGLGPVFDFATTAVAGMKISEARRLGQRLPPGSLVDRDGRLTDDPDAFVDGGSHVPFGGHKGYAISVEAEWLGRIATGADDFSDASPADPVMRHQGVLMVFIRADLFSDGALVRERGDAMAERIRSAAPAVGFDRVQLPGDPERTTRARRSAEGIPLDPETWTKLVALAEELGTTR